MSSEQDQVRSLAERIARRLSDGASEGRSSERSTPHGAAGGGGDLSALRAGLDEIQQRLTHIESHINHDESCANLAGETQRRTPPERSAAQGSATPTRSPWLSGTYVPATSHPSEERFGIGEAVSELVDYFESEKACNMEPGGKPCDHCGMCSSRGF
jgi:hypothetical protein